MYKAFDLWPAYILDILICQPSTPQNIRTLAAFFTAMTSRWEWQVVCITYVTPTKTHII